MTQKYHYGFKLLDPTGCTYHAGEVFQYNLPGRGEKWAATEHPEPAEKDGRECGAGRLHVHNQLSYAYGPKRPWPWFVRYTENDIIGGYPGNSDKSSVARLELRRISPRVLARALRPPFNWGREANLREADLRGANLRGADLGRANLSWANLRGADLRGADHNKYTIWPAGFDYQEAAK